MADTILTSQRWGQLSCGLTVSKWQETSFKCQNLASKIGQVLVNTLSPPDSRYFKTTRKVWSDGWNSEWCDNLVYILALRIEVLRFETGWQNQQDFFLASGIDTKPKLLSFGNFEIWKGTCQIIGGSIKRMMTQCTPCLKNGHTKIYGHFPDIHFQCL